MTKVTTKVTQAGPAAARAAAKLLHAGGLVAFPTETVYGLGADATRAEAVARIYAAKERPQFNPLIAHVESLTAAQRFGSFNATAVKLAKAFWPGPLTLVVPKTKNCTVCDLATAGLDTVALRVPDHPIAQAILAAFEGPIVAPSANRSGRVSPTRAAHVLKDLKDRVDLIVDGGSTPIGLELTIIGCTGDTAVMLRPGGLSRDAIEAGLGARLLDHEDSEQQPNAPGQLASHYAPRAAVRLDATHVDAGEALLAFGIPLPCGGEVLNLSPTRDLKEAAANLFGYLRTLDDGKPRAIAVMRIPEESLGEAINDRLRRAAAPRR